MNYFFNIKIQKMQKITSCFAIATAVLALSVASCKKEVVLTPKDHLTTGSWKLIAETQKGLDSYTLREACEKDNFETFTAAGKFVVDEGATKCKATDPQMDSSDYTVSADNKTITIKDATLGISFDFTVLELTATSLKTQLTFFGTTTVATYAKK